MTDKFKYILITIAAILFLAGCDSNGSYNAEDVEGAGYILAGYYMMAGEETAISEGTSRATAPTWWDDYEDLTYAEVVAMGTDGLKITNYPEQGQKTYITMTVADATNDVYFISSRTEYPNRDVIDYYIEEYYLQRDPFQTAPDKWSTGIIVSIESTDWVELTTTEIRDESKQPKARETMEVHFEDGSVRYEWITETHADNTSGNYAPFDIDGNMTIPTNEEWAPETQSTGMQWSSKVYYYHNVQADIDWFTVENKEIFGVRYYTEDSDSNSSSLAYEQMISQTTPQPWLDENTWIVDIANWLFGGGDSSDDVTLAETVIRYELNGNNNKKTTRTTSNVVNSFGNTITIDLETEY